MTAPRFLMSPMRIAHSDSPSRSPLARRSSITLFLLVSLMTLAAQGVCANENTTTSTLADNDAGQGATPAFSGMGQEIVRLDSGVLVQGDKVHTPDGYTSGFRLTAGMAPEDVSGWDLGAELRYRHSDDVPMTASDSQHVQDVTSLGGSLVAGYRIGQFGVYGKTGMAQWISDPVTGRNTFDSTSGSTRVQGFGARWMTSSWIGQVEFEEVDDRELEHLNMITASFHLPF
ncbi:hypothetical protein KUV41_15470 [Halomonas sp. DP8Y7-1]|uniref:hypothetical protein n=1 Tax=Halomonas sp. DP8Y7-1 TaxID=2859078 RepID=UPI001C9683FE|nr:hypothetical protein [Halomonas sp. DP8Y7-1]MBY6030762.1 hypothetical protein [Halomonas sp. DP8Y7-1]